MKDSKNIAKNATLKNFPQVFGQVAAERKAIQHRYNEAKEGLYQEVINLVRAMPEEQVILNRDLAAQCGISPAHMAGIMRLCYNNGVATDHVNVTRRFVEVDTETGEVIPGGGEVIRNSVLTCYTKSKSRW